MGLKENEWREKLTREKMRLEWVSGQMEADRWHLGGPGRKNEQGLGENYDE